MRTCFQILCYCFSVLFTACAIASEIEVLEVLAPKQAMAMSAKHASNYYVDPNYTFTPNRTIGDQLQSIAGVSFTGQGGQYQSYSIRGFSRGRIRTEIDGIPIITDRRAGNSASFIAPDLFSLASVSKGPSSALYGSQALGGVVSLSTEVTQNQINISGQLTNDEVNASIKHRQGDITSALAYQHANNAVAPNGDEINSQFERLSGLVRYQNKTHNYTTVFSWLPSYGHHIGKHNQKFPLKEVSTYPDEIHSLAQIQLTANSGWLAKLFHHYQNWDSETLRRENYTSLTQYQSNTLGASWLKQYDTQSSVHYLGVDWLARKGVRISSQYDFLHETNLTNTPSIYSTLLGKEDNIALFSQHNWQLNQVKFVAGFRLDWIKQAASQASLTDNQANASLTLSTPLTENVEFSYDIANGFRYPTLSERLFSGPTPRGDILGNADLSAETSLGHELALNWFANSDFSLHGTAYRYALDNYIERYRINDNTLSYRNLSSATIQGVELELRWTQNSFVEHHISFAQQRGVDNLNQPLEDMHPRKLSWVTLAEFNKWTVSNSLNYQLETSHVASSEVSRDSVLIWDIAFSYQLSDQHTLRFTINNLSDASFYASLDEDAGLQPERHLRIASQWRF